MQESHSMVCDKWNNANIPSHVRQMMCTFQQWPSLTGAIACVCALNSRTREKKNSLSCCSSSDIAPTHANRTRFFLYLAASIRFLTHCSKSRVSFRRRWVRERVNGLANFEHALLCTLLISMGMQIRRHR